MTIPSPPKEANEQKRALLPGPGAHAPPPGGVIRVEPTIASQTASSQTSSELVWKNSCPDNAQTEASNLKPRAASAPFTPEEHHRIAALTPAIKLDMVRAVRRRILDESSWLPGKINGANAYAAKPSQDEPVLVDVGDPEATRFSLIGAFLLEFRLRQVVTTAAGRTEFLDQEIPDAIRGVLLDEMSEQKRDRTASPLASNDLIAISHRQCMAVLDVLEDCYAQGTERARKEKTQATLGSVRLKDLVSKLEHKARVTPEDVALALYHELADVRHRLGRLESRAATTKETAPPSQ